MQNADDEESEGVERKSVGNPVDQFKIYLENILRDQE